MVTQDTPYIEALHSSSSFLPSLPPVLLSDDRRLPSLPVHTVASQSKRVSIGNVQVCCQLQKVYSLRT